jgi:hypothetical protein
VEGKDSVAIVTGIEGKARGKIGCWIVLSEWAIKNNVYSLNEVKSFKVDGIAIKEMIFYTLKNGQAVDTSSYDSLT